MADLNYLQVELDISQNDFPKLGPQQKGTVTTDAYPDRNYPDTSSKFRPRRTGPKQPYRSKSGCRTRISIYGPT